MRNSSSRPRARKPHQCDTCHRRIELGEVYRRVRVWEGDEAWTFRQCAHCDAVSRLWDTTDFDYCISESGFLSWSEDRRPNDLTEARAIAGYRKCWRTQSGAFWPIPKYEEEAA